MTCQDCRTRPARWNPSRPEPMNWVGCLVIHSHRRSRDCILAPDSLPRSGPCKGQGYCSYLHTFLRYVSSYQYDHPMLSGWRGDMPFFLISRPRRVAQSTQVESFSFEALSLEVPNGYNSIGAFRRQRWCVIHALYSHTPQPSMDRSPCTNGHISGRCGSKAAALPRLSLWKFQREIHPSDRITESSSM